MRPSESVPERASLISRIVDAVRNSALLIAVLQVLSGCHGHLEAVTAVNGDLEDVEAGHRAALRACLSGDDDIFRVLGFDLIDLSDVRNMTSDKILEILDRLRSVLESLERDLKSAQLLGESLELQVHYQKRIREFKERIDEIEGILVCVQRAESSLVEQVNSH